MHKYDRPRPLFYIAPKHPSPLLHNYRLLNNLRNMSQTSQSSVPTPVSSSKPSSSTPNMRSSPPTPPHSLLAAPPLFSSPPTISPDHSTPALPIPPRLGDLATPELEGVVANPEAYSERNSAHSSVHLFPRILPQASTLQTGWLTSSATRTLPALQRLTYSSSKRNSRGDRTPRSDNSPPFLTISS
jgi:hypothetical protein